MTEIKEEDIQMSPDTHAECVFNTHTYVLVINSKISRKDLFDYPPELKQLKQQILQDHEDAKKWNDLPDEFCHTSLEDMVKYAEERQIVKRLEEFVKEKASSKRPFMSYEVWKELKYQILEGEK